MPPPETFHRHQTAVYWEKVGDNPYGEPLRNPPVELAVRWEEVDEIVPNAEGVPVALEAKVVVDRDIPVGSLFWLGTLEEWDEEPTNPELMHVAFYWRTPDIKNRHIRRRVGLTRHRGSLVAEAE